MKAFGGRGMAAFPFRFLDFGRGGGEGEAGGLGADVVYTDWRLEEYKEDEGEEGLGAVGHW